MLAAEASSCVCHFAQSSALGAAPAGSDQANTKTTIILRIAGFAIIGLRAKPVLRSAARLDLSHQSAGAREMQWHACPIGALRRYRRRRSARTTDAHRVRCP